MEPALVDRLAQDAADQAAYLPLLQVTLEELWKKGRLVLSNYGTLTDAIRQRGDLVFKFTDYDSPYPSQPRPAAEQAAILNLFLNLVSVSADDDPRRDVRISRAATELTPEQRRLARDLSRARLLSLEDEADAETVNIIHETLISNWDLLREGVKARRQQLRQRARFEGQLQLWLANNRSDDYLLLTNVQLAEARELNEAKDIALRNRNAQEILQRSIEHAEAERQRELDSAKRVAEAARKLAKTERQAAARMRTRNRVITGIGAVAIVAAIIAGWLGVLSNQNASRADQNAATAFAANTQSAQNLSAAQIASTQAVQNLSAAQAASTQTAEQRDEAERQRQVALARQLAAQAQLLNIPDNRRALLLAVESMRRAPSVEGSVPIYSLLDDIGVERTSLNHNGSVIAVAFSPDGKWLATASRDNTARVWEAATGKELARLNHDDVVQAVAFSPDGQWLATASSDNTARVWDAATGQELARLNHDYVVTAVAFSPDGKWLATASGDNTARVWDAATGQEIARLNHDNWVNAVAFSPDGKWLATASRDNTARVWDAASRAELARLNHYVSVTAVAFSPDGKWLATVSGDTSARVWEAVTGKELARLNYDGFVTAVAFSPDGQWLATASDDHTARVWEATTGIELARLNHDDRVGAVAFSPDGKWLATASSDKTARAWEAATGKELARLNHESHVTAVAFRPDGKWLATASYDNTARVWAYRPEDLIALACARLTRNLTQEEWKQYIGDEPYRKTCEGCRRGSERLNY